MDTQTKRINNNNNSNNNNNNKLLVKSIIIIILSLKILLSTFSCHCNDPFINFFIDIDHEPIITGNLRIINNY